MATSPDRTDLAEDRTLLAAERTFSAWVRTSLGSVGVGLGFRALFGPVDPTWVAKAMATLFIALGILVIVLAERHACAVVKRLDSHAIDAPRSLNLKLITGLYVAGALALIASMWVLA